MQLPGKQCFSPFLSFKGVICFERYSKEINEGEAEKKLCWLRNMVTVHYLSQSIHFLARLFWKLCSLSKIMTIRMKWSQTSGFVKENIYPLNILLLSQAFLHYILFWMEPILIFWKKSILTRTTVFQISMRCKTNIVFINIFHSYFHSQGVFFLDSVVYPELWKGKNFKLPPKEPDFTSASHSLSKHHIPFIVNEPLPPRAPTPPWEKGQVCQLKNYSSPILGP